MMGVHYIFSTCLKFFLNRFLRFKKAETKQGKTGDGRSLLQHISRIWSIPLRVLFTQFFGKGEAWREELSKRPACLFSDPMDCSPPGSSVHRIFQARILERIAISSIRESC